MAKRKRSEVNENEPFQLGSKKVRTDKPVDTQTSPSAHTPQAEPEIGESQALGDEAARFARKRAKQERRKTEKLQKDRLKQDVDNASQTIVDDATQKEPTSEKHGKASPVQRKTRKKNKASRQSSGGVTGNRHDEQDAQSGQPLSLDTESIVVDGPNGSQIKTENKAHKEARRKKRAAKIAGSPEIQPQSFHHSEPAADQGPARDTSPDAHREKANRERLRSEAKAKRRAVSSTGGSIMAEAQILQEPHTAEIEKDRTSPGSSLTAPQDVVSEKAAKRRRKREEKARKGLQKAQEADRSKGAVKVGPTNGVDQRETGRSSDLQSRGVASRATTRELLAKTEMSIIRRERKDQKLGIRPSSTATMRESASWKVSEPTGGRMLDSDPIFSSDEEYLLVAYHTYVAVYSTSTLLLVRKLHMTKGERIAAIMLSPSKQDQIYVATASGRIELWAWPNGHKVTQWKTQEHLQSLTAVRQSEAESSDLIFSIGQVSGTIWQLSVQYAQSSEPGRDVQNLTLYTQKQPLSSIQVVDNGRSILLTSGQQLILGTCRDFRMSNVEDLKYVWRTITCPEWIVSLDVRVRDGSNQGPTAKSHLSLSPIDVVVGGLRGSIHIYEDFLRRLIDFEKASQKGRSEQLMSRRLHWHRNAVLAVKWSMDGNYLISGGQETVLILWQLDSGRKDTLPHLGASIESIVVSPGGSSYGIRLADNSAMILSTSDMRPSFSVSGIQIPVTFQAQKLLPMLPTVDVLLSEKRRRMHPSISACMSQRKPGLILFAVPPQALSRVASPVKQNASYIQTFDVGTAHQISRQALTRTKITNLNMGPESNTIEEPDVSHIATSRDGQWLATVDEWMPPKKDLASLAFDNEREREEQIFRQEIYLKFWSWNDSSEVWELVSRVDNPHASEYGNAYDGGRVLALAANPHSIGFATYGEDGSVKSWRPTARRRNGIQIKGKDGKALASWHCRWTTAIESPPKSPDIDATPNAHIAYSPDGSVVAAGLQTSFPSPIYLLDSYSGKIQSLHTGLYTGPLLGLGILGRHLIILSNDLVVWDVVTDAIHYGIDLQLPALSVARLAPFSHLAIDLQHETFALAVPESKSTKQDAKLKSQIAIFDSAEAEPLFVTSLPAPTIALLPATGKKGYYAVDSTAEIRTLTPGQTLPLAAMEVPKVETAPQLGLKAIFGSSGQEKGSKLDLLSNESSTIAPLPQADENDPMAVSQERLAEIFDQGPAYALPPLSELFEQVAGLIGGRRDAAVSAAAVAAS